jgi:hypothetical protein
MENYCEKTVSGTLNWNAAVGSISALSLGRNEPSVGLHSYRFYLPKAIWFEVVCDGVKVPPEKVEVLWHPHKMESRSFFPDVTLELSAFFVDNEVLIVNYKFINSSEVHCSFDLMINGVARNGRDKDKYFHYFGKASEMGSCAVIKQEIDIPDYRMVPIGPYTYHKHRLFWVVDAGAEIEVSENEIGTEHDFCAEEFNRSNYWHAKKPVSLGALQEMTGTVLVGIRWMGIEDADRNDIKDVMNIIRQYKNKQAETLERTKAAFWDDLLGRLPEVKERYRDNSKYMDLYRKAWVCIWQNITGSLVTGRKTVKGPSAFVGKAAVNGFGPAQWETSLVGLLTSYMDADLGAKIIESVLSSVEEDGFIPEDLLYNRDCNLPTMEACLLENIYSRTGRTDFLERCYDNLYKQLVFHIKHPSFYYLSSNSYGYYSYMSSFYSLISMEKIAIAIGKDHSVIRKLRDLKAEVETAFETAWKKKPCDESMTFEVLYKLAEGERLTEILDCLKEHHIPSKGRYFIYRYSDGKREAKEAEEVGKEDKMSLDSDKMVHYLFFIPGLEMLQENELLDVVTQKTFEGLEACGDFYECYYVTGEPWGNGPMGVFGAFGWIWCLMEK